MLIKLLLNRFSWLSKTWSFCSVKCLGRHLTMSNHNNVLQLNPFTDRLVVVLNSCFIFAPPCKCSIKIKSQRWTHWLFNIDINTDISKSMNALKIEISEVFKCDFELKDKRKIGKNLRAKLQWKEFENWLNYLMKVTFLKRGTVSE